MPTINQIPTARPAKTQIFFSQKRSGILLPIISFPNSRDICGTLGQAAYQLADWLAQAKQSVLQVLPLGVTGYSNSPFDCSSMTAGSPYFIDLDLLHQDGLISQEQLQIYQEAAQKRKTETKPAHPGFWIDYGFLYFNKLPLLKEAGRNFIADAKNRQQVEKFLAAEQDWLLAPVLFLALKGIHQGRAWPEWLEEFRQPRKFSDYPENIRQEALVHTFIQWQWQKQWNNFHQYLNDREIFLLGNRPFYPALDSDEVWFYQHLFHLDENGRPLVVAGVPPDYFEPEKGQRWGNPIPRWHDLTLTETATGDLEIKSKKSDHWDEVLEMVYKRDRRVLSLVDIEEFDHWRGYTGYGVIPAKDETGHRCQWVNSGFGRALLEKLAQEFGQPLPLIAENLGVITPAVEKLRKDWKIPGMVIFQFAGWESPKFWQHHFNPAKYTLDDVAYAGTHNNDTNWGWFNSLAELLKKNLFKFLNLPEASSFEEISRAIKKSLLASGARLAMIQMQDHTGGPRTNLPGQTGPAYWTWQLDEKDLTPELAEKIGRLTEDAGRTG